MVDKLPIHKYYLSNFESILLSSFPLFDFLFIGKSYTFSENDAFATTSKVATKNGSIFPIRCHDSDIVNALLFTCCSLACLYMVCNCRKRPKRKWCGLGYRWVSRHTEQKKKTRKTKTIFLILLLWPILGFTILRENCWIFYIFTHKKKCLKYILWIAGYLM